MKRKIKRFKDGGYESADDSMEKEKAILGKFETPKNFKSDRVRNLPSDLALESNKERQDQEMRDALISYGKAMLPGNFVSAAKDEIRKRRASEDSKLLPKLKKGGKVSSASKRADGIAKRGKTRGRIV